VLVRARGEVLALTTLLWHDEVRPRDEVAPGGKADTALVDQMEQLIDAMAVEWDHERYEDRYRARLADVIERKRKGGTVKAPTAEKEPAPTPDLMAALEQTLAQMRGGGGGGGGDAPKEDLSQLSKQELLEKAAEQELSGRSKMTKDELVEALS
jgi:DNA end-binding protein Ku